MPPEEPRTLTTAPERPADVPAFPVPGWERYQCVRFLGQGGMGRVFLAYDPRLRRNVALKFVREDDPESARRILSEARAQARVSHERVCKVYEVGEIEGRVYIAMQFVDGPPLSALAPELTLEQKVLVLRDAAEGLHEAHRAGLVHRDVKPSNILVERAEDGSLKPYVVDFGLARDWKEGATATGTVIGTPQYMAPEQARGEMGALDRRADVYGLGATLYHLLTGAPPIPGSNGLEVLNNIATLEPRPPRALAPDVPADLEAIALKCLEKDRSARYDSARALAEDLNRFLGGEPVQARSGPWYRLRKRLRKQRRLLSAGAAALAVVLFALGWAGLARREVAERERLARRFTELVERVEAMARYSDLSRLHDTTADRQAIRARMDELESEIRRGGELAAGPGHYALGRGFLALGDDEKAREHLESAWQSGFREPRVAYALALVTGRAYQRQLLEAERIQAPAQREARRREVERLYRDPALEYLRQSQGAEVPSADYVAALIAFYEGRFDEALAHLDAIGDKLPWFYEAPKLRGDVLLARATRASNQGERERALADFQAGREAYARAAAAGESVPAIHQAMGELEYSALSMELYGQGDVMPHYERGTEAVSRALKASPEHYESIILEARFLRRLGEYRMNHQGGDVEGPLQKAIASAQRALPLAPARLEARMELGRDNWQWGEYRQTLNQDPREQLRRAAEAFEGIAPEARDIDAVFYLGQIFKVWSEYESQIGADPLANQGKAIDAFLAVTRLDEHHIAAWLNLGITYFLRASEPRNRDIEVDLERANAAFDAARKLNPKHIALCFYQAQVYDLQAKRRLARGQDARPDWNKALELYREGSTINPGMAQFHNGVGQVLLRLAEATWDEGGDPFPLIEQAKTSYRRAAELAPQQGFDNNLGEAYALRASFEGALGKDPGSSARVAIAAYQRTIKLLPEHPAPWSNLGKINALMASVELERGGDPQERLERAIDASRQAIRRNPGTDDGWRYLGEARGLRARWLARRGQARETDFEEADQALQKAIERAPERQEYRVALGHLNRAWAEWRRKAGRDPGDLTKRALTLADELLAVRPEWPEARVLRASVLAEAADAAPSPDEQRDLRQRAQDDFTRAFASNPGLEHAWKSHALLLQKLLADPALPPRVDHP